MPDPQWTLPEAAFVLDQPLDAIKRDVNRRPLKPEASGPAKRAVRCVGLTDLVYLDMVATYRHTLTPSALDDLYVAVIKEPAQSASVSVGPLIVQLKRHRTNVAQRLKALEAVDRAIEIKHGAPVVRGTDIEVHRLAALSAGGATDEEILEDYPSLSLAKIKAATAYARAHPKSGRPYPATSAKRAMQGADLGGLEPFMRPRG
ncbi:MAG: hypothetical protein A2795_11380 [Caulobacterales bacterium RIFCSPHIGHO2_01_FULL_67_30]|nr:MAG: hypothetical protein A2795_11380 [Caulobacterales bacterium RIFCSPHIGHO2_01_FULL_67_30]